MERYEIRKLKLEEANQAADMEQICFNSAEAIPRDKAEGVFAKAAEFVFVAYDKEEDRLAGLVYGLPSNLEKFNDDLFLEYSKKDVLDMSGKNVFICSLEVLPDYRGEGLSSKLMNTLIDSCKKEGRESIILTCHDHLIKFYNRFGFENLGKSESTWGNTTWNEMKLKL